MRRTLLVCSIFMFCNANAKDIFDQQMLRELGYDDATAELFAQAPHFLAGEHQVNIIVNGMQKGSHTVIFGQQGTPCWQPELLTVLGIDPSGFVASKNQCLIADNANNIKVTEYLDRNSLEFAVPPAWLREEKHYASGGKALVLNYDASVYHAQYRSGRNSSNQSITSEAGINFNEWIVRSGQSYYSRAGESDFSRLYTYTQKTVETLSSVIQLGEITTNDPVFGGINLTGAQFFPEQALQTSSNLVAIDTPISLPGTVDVYQRNVLLKSFRVTGGMSTLEDIPTLNRQDDFILRIHNDNGGEETQTIPWVQSRSTMDMGETGFSMAMGKLRLSENNFSLLTLSGSVFQNRKFSVVTGGLVSEDYQAIAARSSFKLTEALLTTLSQTISLSNIRNENAPQARGIKNQATLNYALSQSLSVSASADFRSSDYLEPGSAWSSRKTVSEAGQIKTQYSSGLSWHHSLIGNVSVSGTVTNNYRSSDVVGYLMNWGKSFGSVNTNLGIQKHRLIANSHRYDDSYVYLNLSFPLGKNSSLRSYVNHTNGQSRIGSGFSQTMNDKFIWGASSEKSQNQRPSVGTSASWTNKYSKLNGSISKGENTTYNLGMRGGAVLHTGGLTFTPHQVADTFGIISLNSPEPDVEISTSGGKVWTDRQGYAVASWHPWTKNTLQINNRSLKKNVQVQGGIAEIMPSRGAVLPVTLPAHHVRRALMSFLPDSSAASGAPVKNSQNELVAFVNEDGTIFFDDLPDSPLYSQTNQGRRCLIEPQTPWKEEANTLYSTLIARCKP